LSTWQGGDLALSTLDGHSEDDLLEMQTPHDLYTRDITPGGGIPKSVKAAPPKPANPFAPPEANEPEVQIALAVEQVSLPQVSLPTPKAAPAAAKPAARPAPKVSQQVPGDGVPEGEAAPKKAKAPGVPIDIRVRTVIEFARRILEKIVVTPRPRFVLGAVLAMILTFLPAHLVASALESVIYSGAREDLAADYLQKIDQGTEAMLGLKEAAIVDMNSSRRFIAFFSFLVWLACATGVVFLWDQKLDLSKFGKFLASKKWTPPPRPVPVVEPPADDDSAS
jgi:hypothetical protein